MKEDKSNKNRANSELNRRDFLLRLTGLTAGLMLPTYLLGKGNLLSNENNYTSDRLGDLLPLRRLGEGGPYVTNLCIGGDHIGKRTEAEAQALIEKALEEGIRFFDNAHMYVKGRAEEYYGKFLTPKYRDEAFIMTKSAAKTKADVLKELDTSLLRMKTDYVDLWQIHAIESPKDVKNRIKNGVLEAFLEAQQKGKVKYIGFTGHTSYKAHLKMLSEIKKHGAKMVSTQMPVNPADPHYESFITHVVPQCVESGIGVLAMKSLAWGRFFGGNKGWLRTNVNIKPIVPDVLSIDDVLGFAYSLPITALVSGMETEKQISQNAAIARKAWNWTQEERQKRIDALKPFAGPDLEFYKA